MKLSFNSSTSSAVFHAENIPAELRRLPQFVCWHYVDRNGKPTQPPVDAKSNGKLLPAKSNDPSTWASFETAVATAERLNLAGIGLALSASDGLTGLDLDHVIDPATGELDALAHEVLAKFAGTYAEISPSGNGLRIWCYGKPQRSGKCIGKVKWLEVYSHPSSRYLTVTGNHWPHSAGAVTDQQAALDWLHQRFMQDSTGRVVAPEPLAPPPVDTLPDDAALIAKALKAVNGAVFGALWSGETSGHGGDHSAADMALLNLLAFWTDRDPARTDRLFRQSGLMRPKWDVVHHADGSTYGQSSIAKAIADCREGYSGKPDTRAQPEAETEADKWRNRLLRDGDKKIVKVHYNAVLIAEHAFPGLVGFNEFTQRIEARTAAPWRKAPGPWTDYDTQELSCYLVAPPISLPAFRLDMLETAVQTAARRHPFNPAQERLRALGDQWDGVPRLDSWLTRYLNAETTAENRAYLAELGPAFMKGVAARVLFPGCKRDDVLALVGAQGYVKSGAAQAIADCILPNTFTDSLGNLGSDEAAIGVQGIIVAEFSELAAMRRSELEAVKAFISRPSDRYRPKYARNQIDQPRTCSFIATTNEDSGFLRDPSGNRRWWPITITAKIDLAALKSALPLLMGEAAQRALAGEPWHVSDAEALRQAESVRADCADSDVWEPAVLNIASRLNDRDRTIGNILADMGVSTERQDRRAQTRVSNILRGYGYQRKRGRATTGGRCYLWLKLSPISTDEGQKGDRGLASEIAAVPPVPICPYQQKDYISEAKTDDGAAKNGEGEKRDFIGNKGDKGGQGTRRGTNTQTNEPTRTADDGLSSHQPSPLSPVDSLSGLDGDAQTLATVLKHYRGWAEPGELARKSGLGSQERVLTAAQSLVNTGLALMERGMIKPAGVEVRS